VVSPLALGAGLFLLLAPLTAKIIADLVMDGHTGFACEAFSPERFARDAT